MVTYSSAFTQSPNAGLRLDDALSVFKAVINANGISRAYAITALGTTQATATSLTAVLNQIDTAAASTGVNLPLTTGTDNTPFCFCVVINNGANTVKVYGAKGSSDTINGTAGSTGVTQASGVATLYISAKGGAWFNV